jgi:hypothetical protein
MPAYLWSWARASLLEEAEVIKPNEACSFAPRATPGQWRSPLSKQCADGGESVVFAVDGANTNKTKSTCASKGTLSRGPSASKALR